MAVVRSMTPGFVLCHHKREIANAATPDLSIKSDAESVAGRTAVVHRPVSDVPIRGNAPSVPMPNVVRVVHVPTGYTPVMDTVTIDGERVTLGVKRTKKGGVKGTLAAGYVRDPLTDRGVTTRSTFTRRWSKKGRTSQTQVSRSDPFVKRGVDAVTGKAFAVTSPGSIKRVGNVPTTLAPDHLRDTAGLMSPGDDVDAIEYGRKGDSSTVTPVPWVKADPDALQGPMLGPIAPLGSR